MSIMRYGILLDRERGERIPAEDASYLINTIRHKYPGLSSQNVETIFNAISDIVEKEYASICQEELHHLCPVNILDTSSKRDERAFHAHVYQKMLAVFIALERMETELVIDTDRLHNEAEAYRDILYLLGWRIKAHCPILPWNLKALPDPYGHNRSKIRDITLYILHCIRDGTLLCAKMQCDAADLKRKRVKTEQETVQHTVSRVKL